MDDPGILLGLAIAAVTLAILGARTAPKVLRTVGQDERLVVFRAGRVDPGSVRGPGRTLLFPVIDDGVLVSLAPQRLILESIPMTTAGGGVAVDMEVAFRVVDPLRFALATLPPPLVGVRVMAKHLLRAAAKTLDPADARDTGRLEQVVGRALEELLAQAGATGVRVSVLRTRVATATESEERAVMGRLGFLGAETGTDDAGGHTIPGDLRWGLGRIRQMFLASVVLVPLVTAAVLVFGPFGRPSLSATSLLGGALVGLLTGAFIDMPDGARQLGRRIGWRRVIVWWLAAGAWLGASLGPILLIAAIVEGR